MGGVKKKHRFGVAVEKERERDVGANLLDCSSKDGLRAKWSAFCVDVRLIDESGSFSRFY